MVDTIPVHLTQEESLLFVQFQKRFAFMKLLESVGAFDIRSGSLTIFFDNIGGIGSIDIQRKYKCHPYPQVDKVVN